MLVEGQIWVNDEQTYVGQCQSSGSLLHGVRQSSRDPSNGNVETTVYTSQHQEQRNVARSQSSGCSSDDVADHTERQGDDQMAISFLTTVTADGDRHGADSGKDIWGSDEKQRLDLVVAESLDEGRDEGSDGCGGGLGDDNTSKKPDLVVGDCHSEAREKRASLLIVVAVTVAKSEGGNALFFF
jgi:hypothetical protein